MRPVYVKLKDGVLSWLHQQPQPYTVYIRNFKDRQYSVYRTVDTNSVEFNLTDVQVQIRPAGVQPSLDSLDDYYVFLQDRVHASTSLNLSYARDIFRNQLPEVFTQRFEESSSITQLAQQLSVPIDTLIQNIENIHFERDSVSRQQFSIANKQYITYTGRFDKVLAYEYSYNFKSVRFTELKNVQSPEFPDVYVPVLIDSFPVLDIFSKNVVHEHAERGIIFEDNSRCAVQFDLVNQQMYIISHLTGSVIQSVKFDGLTKIGGFETDGKYIYILEDQSLGASQLYDYQQADIARFDTVNLFKTLYVYKMPEYESQTMTPIAQIKVDVMPDNSIVQIKLYQGQMLQLLEDGRIQFLQPKYYSYYVDGNTICINDTFQQIQFQNSSKSTMQRIRKFVKQHTTVDDLMYLYGMHRSEAEEPARQLYRLFTDMFKKQHVSNDMYQQIVQGTSNVQIMSLKELELNVSSDVVERLIQMKQLKTQPTFETQTFDVSDISTHDVAQQVVSLYDTQQDIDAFTTPDDKLERQVHTNSTNPVQQFKCEYMFIKEKRQGIHVYSTDWFVFKRGIKCVHVAYTQLDNIVHITDIDAQYISSGLTGKRVLLQSYPHRNLKINGKKCIPCGIIDGMYQYQIDSSELAKNNLVAYSDSGLVNVYDFKTVAYQYRGSVIMLSRPLSQFYLVRVVNE